MYFYISVIVIIFFVILYCSTRQRDQKTNDKLKWSKIAVEIMDRFRTNNPVNLYCFDDDSKKNKFCILIESTNCTPVEFLGHEIQDDLDVYYEKRPSFFLGSFPINHYYKEFEPERRYLKSLLPSRFDLAPGEPFITWEKYQDNLRKNSSSY